jgi:outer membrane protein TolC
MAHVRGFNWGTRPMQTLRRDLLATIAAGSLGIVMGGCAIAPSPLTESELSHLAGKQAEQATANQEPISGALTLYEAMARAVKYNLDYRVEMMTQSLRGAEAAMASSDMLPKLVANAGWTGRDSYLSSAHLDLPTGRTTPPAVTSSDKDMRTADITFSWNILDFALSYARAQQASDKYLIAETTKRKVIQRILEDTRTAYWRAASADRMVKKLRALDSRLTQAIASARKQGVDGAASPITALTYERELVQIRVRAEQLQRELTLAKAQLAALMDVAPGVAFSLADSEDRGMKSALNLSLEEMVAEALFNRPELREIAYQRRINEREATAALLELLPGLRLYASANEDSNSFLLNNNWVTMGASAAFNLIKVVSLPARRNAIEMQDGVLDQKSLAATMVVLTQVHVSRIRYRHFTEELETAQRYSAVQRNLVAQIRAQVTAGVVGEQTLIREEMNALLAEVRRDIAFTNVQNAAANIYVSMGLDLQANEVNHALSVKQLAAHLKSAFGNRIEVSDRARHLLEKKAAKSTSLDGSAADTAQTSVGQRQAAAQ